MISDSAGFELVDAEVVGVFDPELFAILDRKVMPRLKADLKILLYLVADEASPDLTEELVAVTSLQKKTIN